MCQTHKDELLLLQHWNNFGRTLPLTSFTFFLQELIGRSDCQALCAVNILGYFRLYKERLLADGVDT